MPAILKTLYLILRVSPVYERRVPNAPKILILGDSTGYGTGATRKADTIAGRIGTDFPKYTIENNSKNGRTIGELLDVVRTIEGEYELILLQIGGNDILQKRDQSVVERELREIVALLTPRTKHLIMMTSGNVGGAVRFKGERAREYEVLTRTLRTRVEQIAHDTALTYVDLFLEPPVDIFILEPEKYFSIDGLHPSSAGYASWYAHLQPVLIQRLN